MPVNWFCNGQEFALLSTDPKYGGMLDGHFRRAVMFPNDDNPDLAYYVLDVNGDGRDEVLRGETTAYGSVGRTLPHRKVDSTLR